MPVDCNHSNNSAHWEQRQREVPAYWLSTSPLTHHSKSQQHGDDVTQSDGKGKKKKAEWVEELSLPAVKAPHPRLWAPEPEYKTSDWTISPILSASIISESAAQTSPGAAELAHLKVKTLTDYGCSARTWQKAAHAKWTTDGWSHPNHFSHLLHLLVPTFTAVMCWERELLRQ